MKTNLIIVDDFYNNPDDVRALALSQEFTQQSHFPGLRTKSFLNQAVKDVIQHLLHNVAGQVTNWHEGDGSTGSFELALARDRSWIHTDHHNTWAGVCYLTPNAPLSGGTAIYQYKATGARIASELPAYETQDMTKWEMTDYVANRYNRLVMYRSDQFHNSLNYFGSDPHSGRLFQLFFLTTEY